MFGIICDLLLATTISLVDSLLHRWCNFITIHDDLAINMACCTTCGLCQRTMVTQEAFLIRIQNSY